MDTLGLFRLDVSDLKITVIVISTLCSTLSFLLLSTHLIVFSISETMRTIMGKNLASFCVSCLLAFSSYICAVAAKTEFIWSAVMTTSTYYFFFTHTTWLICIAFECCNSSDEKKSRRTKSNRFFWYAMFAWIEPAVIISIAAYAQFFDTCLPNYLRPSFLTAMNTDQDVSERRFPFLIFFVVPFAVHIATNVIFLVCARCSNGGNKNYESLHRNSDTRQFTLYKRLNVIILFTWMLSLVNALFIRNDVFIIALVILNSIQAIYIFLVFTFNNTLPTLIHKDSDLNLKPLPFLFNKSPVLNVKTTDKSVTVNEKYLKPAISTAV